MHAHACKATTTLPAACTRSFVHFHAAQASKLLSEALKAQVYIANVKLSSFADECERANYGMRVHACTQPQT